MDKNEAIAVQELSESVFRNDFDSIKRKTLRCIEIRKSAVNNLYDDKMSFDEGKRIANKQTLFGTLIDAAVINGNGESVCILYETCKKTGNAGYLKSEILDWLAIKMLPLEHIVKLTRIVGKRNFGVDALRSAFEKGDVKTARFVLERLTDKSGTKDRLDSAIKISLPDAALRGNLDMLKFLFGLTNIEKGQPRLDDALENAAQNGDMRCISFLLDKGANPNIHQAKPLKNAARFGHIDAVKKLFPISSEAVRTTSPLMAAAKGGHAEIMEWLFDRSDIEKLKSLHSQRKESQVHLMTICSMYEKHMLSKKHAQEGHQCKPKTPTTKTV